MQDQSAARLGAGGLRDHGCAGDPGQRVDVQDGALDLRAGRIVNAHEGGDHALGKAADGPDWVRRLLDHKAIDARLDNLDSHHAVDDLLRRDQHAGEDEVCVAVEGLHRARNLEEPRQRDLPAEVACVERRNLRRLEGRGADKRQRRQREADVVGV